MGIPHFNEALKRFKEFIAEHVPDTSEKEILWITEDDIVFEYPRKYYYRETLISEPNTQALYEEGKDLGYGLSLTLEGCFKNLLLCTLMIATSEEEASSKFIKGFTMKVVQNREYFKPIADESIWHKKKRNEEKHFSQFK
ncbi:MAG: hypothetical protein ABUK01_13570 [Leptospirales bacterium]